jgi:hypothetical protein
VELDRHCVGLSRELALRDLHIEVRFVEMVARLRQGVPAGPPTEAELAHMVEVERGVLSGQISHLAEAPMADDPTAVKPSKMGRVRSSPWMPADLAASRRII